jgi:hypothetical protein
VEFRRLTAMRRVPTGALSTAYLVPDRWDDWFTFETMFSLIVVDDVGQAHTIGMVKIGQRDMRVGQRTADVPEAFRQLDSRFFSLGQDEEYYQNLNNMGDEVRESVLLALNDIALDLELFEGVQDLRVTNMSLMRSITASTVRGQLNRMAHGGARLSRYEFAFEPTDNASESHTQLLLEFRVEPESSPPTNVHVLIGRNGVGKTRLFAKMTDALLQGADSTAGVFRTAHSRGMKFANLVSVSFSAFDDHDVRPSRASTEREIGYAFIGLQSPRVGVGESITPKTPEMLADEFVESVDACLQGSKRRRWVRAIETLQVDPVFREANVVALASRVDRFRSAVREDSSGFGAEARDLFRRLSSGHKIILITITRLVELVEERTLVLLDEPEAHLHPPLLAGFVRALSELLVDRNGVALVASHSPVVLQEVPASCVHVMRRSGSVTVVERPSLETFGESVSVLAREVFGLELSQSGFHALLQQSVLRAGSYEAVMNEYEDQLGGAARALVRALLLENEDSDRRA